MNCHKCRKLKIEYLEQSLSPAVMDEINRHLNECGACSRLFAGQERFEAFFKDVMRQKTADMRFTPSIDLEAVRQVDEPQRRLLPSKVFGGFTGLRLKPALAVLAAGFILGFLFHSFYNVFFQRTAPRGQVKETAAKILSTYFEDVKPVIIEYAACSAEPEGGGDLLPGKEIITRLLQRNRVLRNRLPLHKKEQLRQLLDELELILTKIANLDAEDGQNMGSDSCSAIKQLIKDKGILFKLEVSDSGEETSLTI